MRRGYAQSLRRNEHTRRARAETRIRADADFPDFSVVAQRWIGERQGAGLPLPEEEFMTHVRAVYPDASYQLPKIHDFQKFVAAFAWPGRAAERARNHSQARS